MFDKLHLPRIPRGVHTESIVQVLSILHHGLVDVDFLYKFGIKLES